MPKTKKAPISPRKKPQQERSSKLVEAILEAAIRVLSRHGASGFTTIRVAEQAGVSVGSLYQYFPNKQSILFRLQEDEWKQTGAMLAAIFTDTRHSPEQRIRLAMRAFFRSECDEAPLRRALDAAAPLYHDVPEAQEQKARGIALLNALISELAPALSPRKRAFAAELFIATMGSLGKHVSEREATPAEVDTWANASADMFLAYLQKV